MSNSISVLNRAADNIRILAAAAVEKAKSGHPGGAMGGADFINVLYSEYLTYDPKNPSWAGRDRFFLDPGHMAPMLYSQLCLTGKYSLDELQQLRQWNSPTPGHPEFDVTRGIENSSGPLGQGHAYAVGAAIAAKFLAAHTGNPTFAKETVYAYISDGGIEEEISQGSARIAANLGLDNLVMFYDSNDIQLSTETNVVMNEDTAAKFRAFGWEVFEIDGNDVAQIRKAIEAAKAVTGKPALIIGKCIMGKGAIKADGTSYERSCKTHGAPLGGDAFINTVKNLGGDPDQPFRIFPEVAELYAKRAEELEKISAERYAEEKVWAEANPGKAAQLAEWFSGNAPRIDWSNCAQKENDATRNASAACLGVLAEQVPNMIVSSADLSNSDKTDGFLKKTHAMQKGDFSGAFFQAGVAELTMACCCIGMALHGGVIPACGTFFVFSDYMKPAVRMAALMELPVKFIWTHDAFRVGEDGPTHQPIEQAAALRLTPNVALWRPCDSTEAASAWTAAVEYTAGPVCLVMSRQNLVQQPRTEAQIAAIRRGGYVLRDCEGTPELIYIATGSEVQLAMEAAARIAEQGRRVRVVSMPSCEVFDAQDAAYRESVLPSSVRARVAIEAQSANWWWKYVGIDGRVIGMSTFGASAPAGKLFPHFGFTVENVMQQGLELL